MFSLAVSPGVQLTLLEEADAPALRVLIDRNREHLRQWLAWVDQSRTVEDLLVFIQGVRARFRDNDGFACLIRERGEAAGAIGLHSIDWPNRSTSIGYWLAAQYQGRGLMTAACRAVLRHVFRELGLHRVEIRCGTGNRKSCAIPERLGFRHEGVLREAEWVSGRAVDLNLYSLLATDPAATVLTDPAPKRTAT